MGKQQPDSNAWIHVQNEGPEGPNFGSVHSCPPSRPIPRHSPPAYSAPKMVIEFPSSRRSVGSSSQSGSGRSSQSSSGKGSQPGPRRPSQQHDPNRPVAPQDLEAQHTRQVQQFLVQLPGASLRGTGRPGVRLLVSLLSLLVAAVTVITKAVYRFGHRSWASALEYSAVVWLSLCVVLGIWMAFSEGIRVGKGPRVYLLIVCAVVMTALWAGFLFGLSDIVFGDWA